MDTGYISRRDYLKLLGGAAALAATGRSVAAARLDTATLDTAIRLDAVNRPDAASPLGAAGESDRAQRMKWWHEARFGMFIHWGLYSVAGRHEWVMENEGIPVPVY